MTVKSKGVYLRAKKLLPISELLILASFLAMFTLSDTLKRGVWSGLVLTAGTILPSVFPFMVIGDFVSAYIFKNGLGIIERPLLRILGISRAELGIVISGLLCGFPSSAKSAAELCRNEKMQKEPILLTSALCSNPSPSFIIGAVGCGLFNDIRTGALILVSLYLSIVITKVIYNFGWRKQINSNIFLTKEYNFVKSVKECAAASITVFAFVALFCGVSEVLKSIVGCGTFFSFLVSFIEISAAAVQLANESKLPIRALHSLLGFSVGFGGICANLQCISFLCDAGFSAKKFLKIKLTLGLVCSILTPLIFVLLK